MLKRLGPLKNKFDFSKEQVQDLQNSFSILTPDLFQLAVVEAAAAFAKPTMGKQVHMSHKFGW
jgi:hypothetical protein